MVVVQKKGNFQISIILINGITKTQDPYSVVPLMIFNGKDKNMKDNDSVLKKYFLENFVNSKATILKTEIQLFYLSDMANMWALGHVKKKTEVKSQINKEIKRDKNHKFNNC